MCIKKSLIIVIQIFILNAFATKVNAQTFIGNGGPIVDYDTNYFSQSITSLPTDKLRSQYGLQSVELNITHPYVQNLIIYLISPNGTIVNQMRNAGGNGDNFTSTILTDSAPTNIQPSSPGLAPFTGVFQPNQPLGNINNYQSGIGN
jgi:hypothetical protein